MDGSGGNRYELLYMDDDASDPLENLVRKKAKHQKQKNAGGNNTNSGNEKQQTNQQQQQQKEQQQHGNKKSMNIGFGAEKENKSSALNKNIDKKTGGVQVPAAAAQGGPSGGGQKQKGTTNSTQGGQFKDQSNYRNSQDQKQQRDGKSFDRNANFKQNGETREQRNNRRNRDERPQQNGTIAPGEYQQNAERPQRRGGPPRRNFDQGGGRGGKREFDRQSGSDKTGVKAVDKRDGAGAHNWGSPKQDIEDITKSHDDGVLTDKDESAGDQQIEQQTANIEEETKELTLDEWKAQRAVRAKPQFNIRKAGEGEDLSQWKKMVALNNKKRDEESEEELEYDPSMYPQRVGRLQRVLDIEFHFNDGRRVGGIGRGRGRARGQGGQGGGSGGGAGGGGRQGRVPRNAEGKILKEGGGERQQRGVGGGGQAGQHAPKVDDEHDFPSLG